MPNPEVEKKEPVLKVNAGVYSVSLYQNRIEYKEWGGLGRRQMIPYRSIASVERHQLTSRVTVQTNDGKRHTFALGIKFAAFYDTLLSLL
jgi:hypothetical protein